MNTAAERVPGPQSPVNDVIGQLEGQIAKIHNISSELASRIVGPSPSCTEEGQTTQNHILGRLQTCTRQADQIANDLEALLHQL